MPGRDPARASRRTLLLAGGVALGGGLASCAIPNGPTKDFTSEMDGTGPVKHAYGDDPSQFGELTLPAGSPRGVVVVIHGGFWKAEYALDLGRPLAASLASAGWAAWNLEYRRVGSGDGGGGGVPATLDDVAAGIDHLAGLDLDLDRPVVALGHSAGGHLAVWAASRGRFERWQPARVPLTGAVSQAGVLDLATAYETNAGDGAVARFLGHAYGEADAPVDPIRQVPLDIPVWCVHATSDDVVPLPQSQAYVAAAQAAGATAELIEVDGDHFTLIDPDSDAWATTLEVLDGVCGTCSSTRSTGYC